MASAAAGDDVEVVETPAKRPRQEGPGTPPAAGVARPLKQASLLSMMGAKRPKVEEGPKELSAEEAAARARARDQWLPLLGQGWYEALEAELRRPTTESCIVEVAKARASSVVFPPPSLVFRAFAETPLEAVRVVIVGQDPYHGRGQAMGLSFSVPRGVRTPPSLVNMLREAGVSSQHGDLTSWARQGVFLLNTMLTVQEGKPLSHKSLGWERFTDAAIRSISREREGVIFLLWGREAQAKGKMVDGLRHKILSAGHPSPLSYENHFKGCGHFAKVNEILAQRGQPVIDWQLPP